MKILLTFLIFSSMGVYCLLAEFVKAAYFRYREKTQTKRAEAEFVNYTAMRRQTGKHSHEIVYQLVVRYKADLQDIRATSSYFHREKVLRPGDKMIIYFNPNRPEKFRLEEETGGEVDPFMIRLGLGCIGVAAVLSILAEIFAYKEWIRF